MSLMRAPIAALVVFSTLPALAQQPEPTLVPVTVEKARFECASRDEYPRAEVTLAPPESVAEARLLFKSRKAKGWYAVRLRPEGSVFSARLPRPRWLDGFTAYVEATDRQGRRVRGEEQTVPVGRGACAPMTGAVAVRDLLVEKPEGSNERTPPVPPGFSRRGLPGDIGVFELSKGATVAGVGVVLGGIAAGVATLSREENRVNPPPDRPPLIYTVDFLGSTPAPGSTVSLGTPLTLTLRVQEDALRTYGGPRASALRLGFIGPSGQPCVGLDYRLPFSFFAVPSATVTITGPARAVPGCTPPFTTDSVMVTMMKFDFEPVVAVAPLRLSVGYQFVE